MVKSWKTTVSGVLVILSAGIVAFQQYLGNGMSAVQWEGLATALLAGIGLVFAKDATVTNSQNPGPANTVPKVP